MPDTVNPNRRSWNRIPIPPVMYELLIHFALISGYNERTLYLFLWRLLIARHKPQVIDILEATEEIQGIRLQPDLRARLLSDINNNAEPHLD